MSNDNKKISDVWFTDFRTSPTEGLTEKLKRLLNKAGFMDLPLAGKIAAIKMHFGERGNLAFLRPNYARAISELTRNAGGMPFLTDCNTLYVGGRGNAIDHLQTADLNGFTPLTTGCHIVIGDGLRGTDEVCIPLKGTDYIREAKIGRAIVDADVIISLNHFKGHELMGMGGAVKNLGMGCASRRGKMEMHSGGKPVLDRDICVNCGMCAKVCAQHALEANNGKMALDRERCVGCGRCVGMCMKGALSPEWGDQSNDELCRKTAEYALAVVKGKIHFHVSLICDVSPNCDCHAENDAAVIPDIGMLASLDPVALDAACCDLCMKAPRLHGTVLDGETDRSDLFEALHPSTRWQTTLEHSEKIGLGNMKYRLHNL